MSTISKTITTVFKVGLSKKKLNELHALLATRKGWEGPFTMVVPKFSKQFRWEIIASSNTWKSYNTRWTTIIAVMSY